MSDVYSKAYFDHMASCRDNYRKLADCIMEAVGIGTCQIIKDVGFGLGFVLEKIKEDVPGTWGIGIDNYSLQYASVSCANLTFLQLDFEAYDRGLPLTDISICTETAEHVTDSAGRHLVCALASTTRDTIVWSAAPPGQDEDDPGHINLRPAEYWIRQFNELGWHEDTARTSKLRELMRAREAQHHYAKDNFYVLVRA